MVSASPALFSHHQPVGRFMPLASCAGRSETVSLQRRKTHTGQVAISAHGVVPGSPPYQLPTQPIALSCRACCALCVEMNGMTEVLRRTEGGPISVRNKRGLFGGLWIDFEGWAVRKVTVPVRAAAGNVVH